MVLVCSGQEGAPEGAYGEEMTTDNSRPQQDPEANKGSRGDDPGHRAARSGVLALPLIFALVGAAAIILALVIF